MPSTPLPVIAGSSLVVQHLESADELHTMINRFCVHHNAGAPTPGQLADQVAQHYAATILSLMGDTISLGVTDVTPLDGTTPTETFATPSVGAVGSITTGVNLPLATSLVISWRTGTRGRSHRGRSYLPGVTSTHVVDARSRQLTPAIVASITLQARAFISALAADSFSLELQVLSRKLGTATLITDGLGNPGVCLQRRRYEEVAHR